jgi:hypothetical protein
LIEIFSFIERKKTESLNFRGKHIKIAQAPAIHRQDVKCKFLSAVQGRFHVPFKKVYGSRAGTET